MGEGVRQPAMTVAEHQETGEQLSDLLARSRELMEKIQERYGDSPHWEAQQAVLASREAHWRLVYVRDVLDLQAFHEHHMRLPSGTYLQNPVKRTGGGS